MSKEPKATASPFFRELLQWNVYKKSQGRITRQVTFAAIAIVLALGAWRLSAYMIGQSDWVRVGLPVLGLLAGWWIAFRLVNMPGFADFLIAVEAEMNKVSWPTWHELVRASLVVICMIVFFVVVLFAYDVFWKFLLMGLHVLRGGGGN